MTDAWSGIRRLIVLSVVVSVVLTSLAPAGASAQGTNPRITGLTLDPSFDACTLEDGDTISGTVQSENLADTTAVVIIASFGIGGFIVEWGAGSSIPGVGLDSEFYSSSQTIPENGAWTIGRNAVDARTAAGSDFRAEADTLYVQAELYDQVEGRIPRVNETTGAELPWQVIEIDLTECGEAPNPTLEAIIQALIALLISILFPNGR